jgi:hypothetical protein
LAFDAPRDSVAITTGASPAKSRGEQAREALGRLGPDDPRELGEPLAGRGGLIVDDGVDSGTVELEREHRRCGGVVEVDEGPDAGTVADDRELPRTDCLDRPVAGIAVEDAVPERNSTGTCDGLLETVHRRH